MSRKLNDLTGFDFDRLTVIKRVENNKWGGPQWLCRCKCGNEIIITSSALRSGRTRSCGCLFKEKVSLPNGEANFNRIYIGYKQAAERRGIKFNLTKKQFKIFIDGNCIYCNVEPQQIIKNNSINGLYPYNGIDRVNNKLGYTLDNCVSCCKICNYMKRNMTKEEFLEHIKNIYNNINHE